VVPGTGRPTAEPLAAPGIVLDELERRDPFGLARRPGALRAREPHHGHGRMLSLHSSGTGWTSGGEL